MARCISGSITHDHSKKASLKSVGQEDPYKLVILAKDIHHASITNANFFFTDGQLSLVTADGEGVFRMYVYDPDGEFHRSSFIL